MIQADNLCKVFERNVKNKKESFFAVDHISFEAGSGEIVGILGPNGAGKTTLLRMLGCLMQPTEGSVTITGSDGKLITDTVEKKRNIGYLSGNTKLYHRLSVREMLMMLADIYGIEKKTAESRVENISEILNMSAFLDNRIERLSTGQTQRASIARCLIHEPDIYIFDEPTLGLDILSADSIVSFMKTRKEAGRTVLYSTHYLEEAQFLCDRILMLDKGRIVCQGSPDELLERFECRTLRDAFFRINRGQDGEI